MKVLQINSVYGVKSTGRIAYDLVQLQEKNNIEAFVVSGEGSFDSPNVYVMSGKLYQKLNILLTRLFGRHGFYNKFATRRLIRYMDKVSPDVIHLHNIHGHYINIKLLFEYIQRKNIPVVWTLHDCWAFTGHCPHFDYVGCERWREGCGNCPQQKGYPISLFFDRSKRNFADKKQLFTGVEKMHIVTPSRWLAELAEQSFLGKYPVSVVNNGIDTDVFSPSASDMRERLGLSDKFVILGIVSNLNSTKGGQYFLKMSERLREDEQIVLLSLEDTENLPKNITALPRTESAHELAQIYSMADVFVNPTLQDTFSMINLEALSCGLPVVTFRTGGCCEAVTEECGVLVEKGDENALYEAVCRVRQGEFSSSISRQRGLEFDREICFSKYIDIYKDIVK